MFLWNRGRTGLAVKRGGHRYSKQRESAHVSLNSATAVRHSDDVKRTEYGVNFSISARPCNVHLAALCTRLCYSELFTAVEMGRWEVCLLSLFGD